MSGWTRGSLFAALKAAGVASILGWVLVLLSAGPALARSGSRRSRGCRAARPAILSETAFSSARAWSIWS